MAIACKKAARAVKQLESSHEPTVDAGSQATDKHTLSLLAREHEVIDVRRTGNDAVDGLVQLHALGLGHVVVGFLLQNLVQVAHDKSARIADAPLVDQTNVMDSQERIAC